LEWEELTGVWTREFAKHQKSADQHMGYLAEKQQQLENHTQEIKGKALCKTGGCIDAFFVSDAWATGSAY